MQPFTNVPKPVLLALAVLLGTTTTAYSILWMVHVHHVAGLGSYISWLPNHRAEVRDVERGTNQ